MSDCHHLPGRQQNIKIEDSEKDLMFFPADLQIQLLTSLDVTRACARAAARLIALSRAQRKVARRIWRAKTQYRSETITNGRTATYHYINNALHSENDKP